jgi:hypothetical protein
MASDKGFVAQGDVDGSVNHGFVSAFVDHGTEILDHGVNVQGRQCGVYGESQDLGPDTSESGGKPRFNLTRTTHDHKGRFGVYGVGDDVGVYGKGGRGIEGDGGSDGVFGHSVVTGVRGEGQRSGVEGIGTAPEQQTVTKQSDDPWKGRSGDEFGAGGIFQSAFRAQIRLVPASLEGLPMRGRPRGADVGDLLVLEKEKEGPAEEVSLWLCVHADRPLRGAARWREVQLGPIHKEPIRTVNLIASLFDRLDRFRVWRR